MARVLGAVRLVEELVRLHLIGHLELASVHARRARHRRALQEQRVQHVQSPKRREMVREEDGRRPTWSFRTGSVSQGSAFRAIWSECLAWKSSSARTSSLVSCRAKYVSASALTPGLCVSCLGIALAG
eukprot:3190207-Rhodomonas_salina.3